MTEAKSLAAIEAELERFEPQPGAGAAAQALLVMSEQILEHWIAGRGETPTEERREGFRLLALHKQGTHGSPSFNACRETCREIAYHYNLIQAEPDSGLAAQRQRMMALLAKHLLLFVSGKMQVEGLGEFCCASRPLRTESTQAS